MTSYDAIITALQTALAQIRIANGYRTDAGALVHLNLEYQTAPKQTPCLILFPGDLTDTIDGDTPPSQGEENHMLPIAVEGWIADNESGSEGQMLRQDILKALKADQFFGGLTEGFSGSMASSTQIEDAGADGFFGSVQVTATIFYVTAWGEI